MKILPAIDLKGGEVVRLAQGRFDRSTTYADDPLEVARGLVAAGAGHLHIVDLDGTRDGVTRQTGAIRALLTLDGLATQVGGGLRSLADAQALIDAGAAAVVVGSMAVDDPHTTASLLRRLGPDRVVLALDCRVSDDGVPRLVSHGWAKDRSATVFQTVETYLADGLTQVLCTDVAQDGMLTGPNLALYRELLTRFPQLRLQASGGVRDAADLAALADLGADAAIVGRALYEGTLTLAEALPFEAPS